MSLEHAKQFLNKLQTDEHLRKTVHLDREHIVKSAAKEGYTVTPTEMRQAMKEHWTANPDPDHPASGVLSEAPGF